MCVLLGLFAYVHDRGKCHGQLKGVGELQMNIKTQKTLANAILELFRCPSVFALRNKQKHTETDMHWREYV